MRITAGTYKGAILTVPDGDVVRPTSDRARQAIFNILSSRLNSFQGLTIIDAFAGSGALGLEALSRGAERAFFIDCHPLSLAALRRNIDKLRLHEKSHIVKADATSPPPALAQGAQIAFLDPPYGQDLAPLCLKALADQGWLASGALCIVESGKSEKMEIPAGFTLVDDRIYGVARFRFLTFDPIKAF